MPTETNDFTLTFPSEQLQILCDIVGEIIKTKVVYLEDFTLDQVADLAEVRNKVQKQLDFPDLKF